MATERRMLSVVCWSAAVALLAAVAAPRASGQLLMRELPEAVRGLDVADLRGQQTPADVVLVNHQGRALPFGTYFGNDGRPIVLVLQYYRCPVVCPVILHKLVECLNQLDYTVGDDFKVVVVSFDPTEGTPVAASVRQSVLESYQRVKTPEVRAGWTFHTGEDEQVRRLADSVGFDYRPLANGEYGHPVAFFVLTPGGKVSSVVYGFDYPAREMRLALLDASDGKIARSIGDMLLHFCYRYDPAAGGYVLAAFRVMQLGGVVSMVLVFGLIGVLLVRERAARRRRGVRVRAEVAPAGVPRAVMAGQVR